MADQETVSINSYDGRKVRNGLRPLDGPHRFVSDRGLGYPGKQALEFLDLTGTELVIDAGSGSGHYTFQIAEKLKYGKILALDDSSELLFKLSKRVLKKQLSRRVEALECNLWDIPLADESADAAVCLFLWHRLDVPGKGASELFRLIKPGGKIFAADWNGAENSGTGVPKGFAVQEMKSLLEKTGFTSVRAFLHQEKAVIGSAIKPL